MTAVVLDSLLASLPASTLKALAGTRLQSLDELQTVVGVPSAGRTQILAVFGQPSYVASLDDGVEFTLVVPEAAYLQQVHLLPLSHRAVHTYRFVRLHTSLPWDTIGYGAAIFTALFHAGVSAGFLSGYTTDSLLIHDANWPQAQRALEALFADAAKLAG